MPDSAHNVLPGEIGRGRDARRAAAARSLDDVSVAAMDDVRGVPRARIFHWIAPAFAAAALFHAAALFRPAIAEPVPSWWHALFVGVNLALAMGVVRRPRGFLVIYVIYMLQQFVEHGPRAATVWRSEHRIDWASIVSLVFVPFVLVLLLRDAYAKKESGARAA
jgi:hypothetical protein